MSAEKELLIKVSADTNKAITEINRLNKQVDKLQKQNKKIGDDTKGVNVLSKGYKNLAVTVKALAAGMAALGVAMKAVDFANMAADSQQASDAFNRAVSEMGLNADEEFKKIKAASKGLIPDAEIKQATVSAMSLGVPLESMAGLMEIATAKAREMGTDTSKAFSDIALGISRGSPMILDNLGLTIKLGDANKKMADSLHKTVAALTKQEKTQALLNAVMEAGASSVARYADAGLTAKQQMQEFDASLTNLKVKIGDALLPALTDAAKEMAKWVESLSPADITAMQDGIKGLADSVVTLGRGLAALNDVTMPDWLGGKDSGLLGTVAKGWGEIAEKLDFAVNSQKIFNDIAAQTQAVLDKSTATEKETVRTLYDKNKAISAQIGVLTQLLDKYGYNADAVGILKDQIGRLSSEQSANLQLMKTLKAQGDPYEETKKGAEGATESVKTLTDAQQKQIDKERESAKQRLTIAQNTLDSLYAKEIDLKAKIEKLEAEKIAIYQKYSNMRESIEHSYQNTVADARQKGMSDYQRYIDNQNRAAQALASAKEAYYKKNYDMAKKYLDEYDNLIKKSAGDEIKEGENVLVSRSTTLGLYQSKYKAASDVRMGLISAEEQKAISAQNAKIEAAQRELNMTLLQMQAQKQIIQLYARIVQATTGVKPDIDFSLLDKSIKAVKQQIASLGSKKTKIPFETKVDPASVKQVEKDVKAAKDSIEKDPAKMKIDADTSEGERSAKAFQQGINNAPPVYQTVWADMNNAYGAVMDFVRWANRQSATVTIYERHVQTRAMGGLVSKFASGGRVPGFDPSSSDRVPAMLSEGEFVIRNKAVRYFGQALFDSLNRMEMPKAQRFAEGGSVGGGSVAPALQPININIGGRSFSMMSDRQVAEALQRYLETEGGI